ncbi:hypothetical protein EIP86_007061 [Pleurotus ostreatoroseus]|nr:hypothetical protein EIP86_007061 [Pleurotus ostreatoroseus]
MSSPYPTYPAPERPFVPQNQPRLTQSPVDTKPPPAKRGRKPKNAAGSLAGSPVVPSGSLPLNPPTQWQAQQTAPVAGPSTPISASTSSPTALTAVSPETQPQVAPEASTTVLSLPGVVPPVVAEGAPSAPRASVAPGAPQAEDDGEGEDELLPAMADDDYSAQLSWQSQSKDNLKVLMDNFSPAQYDRFEAYRRHALPKQAVRKANKYRNP